MRRADGIPCPERRAGRFVVRDDGRIDRGHRDLPDNDLLGVTSGWGARHFSPG